MAGGDLPSFHGIIGRSASMETLFRKIQRIAPHHVSVLIQGESGTGKELVASAIQRLGPRRGRDLHVVNCATLTRDLLQSELFGHERGAFTGAVGRKAGLLEVADGGTVFLDEVAELSLEAQGMLLRFLQNGEIKPVGSNRTRVVDVRVISATHQDLEQAALRGAFREDVYHRLCDVVLEIPPLRARRDDIPLLLDHFLEQFNESYGLRIEGLGSDALAMVMAYPWPGNVRSLGKVLKEAMIFRGDGFVRTEDLRISGSSGLPVVGPGEPASRHQTPADAPRVNDRGALALRIARERGSVNTGQLAAESGVSGATARQELALLTRVGYLRQVGKGRGTRYVLR
jgi:transcriptional regulator with GAF, ATPase, and Fis domain